MNLNLIDIVSDDRDLLDTDYNFSYQNIMIQKNYCIYYLLIKVI